MITLAEIVDPHIAEKKGTKMKKGFFLAYGN
jgi:hypothetical protein